MRGALSRCGTAGSTSTSKSGSPFTVIENYPTIEGLAAYLLAIDDTRLWELAMAAKSAGRVEEAAVRFVDYLHSDPVEKERRAEALRYLLEELP